jgi:hypothetical protein
VDKNNGLSIELVNFLNKKAEGKFTFELKVVPRSRLNYILKPWIQDECNKSKACNNQWAVLWVNPKWGFGKKPLKTFAWTPLLDDSNVIISSKKAPFEYTKPQDLISKRFAGIKGHKYVGIDALVQEGKIERIDSLSETDNLNVVLASRVDATLLPASAFAYYQKNNKKFENLYMAKTPHQTYMRNVMVPINNKELHAFLQSLDLQQLFQ